MTRTAGTTTFPEYILTVTSDGLVQFDGLRHTARKGRHTWNIQPNALQAISTRLTELNIFALPESLPGRDSDAATCSILVIYPNDESKQVTYALDAQSLPQGLRALDRMIEKEAAAHDAVGRTVQIAHDGKTIIQPRTWLYDPADPRQYHAFQIEGIAFLVGHPAALLADEMGLGKTIQAIGLINSVPTIKGVLIVCPASLKLNWRDELHHWIASHRDREITIIEGSTPLRGTIFVVSYEVLTRRHTEIASRHWDLVIGDESQKIKTRSAQRTRAFTSLKADRKLLMTGTPILNRPIELWTTLNYLDPSHWKSRLAFETRYCSGDRFTRQGEPNGASNLDELNKRLESTVMKRRRKEDVLTQLPPKTRQVIRLQCPDQQLMADERTACEAVLRRTQQLQEAVEQARLLTDTTEYHRAFLELERWHIMRLGELSTIRKRTGLAKLPDIILFLETALESGQVICFAYHREVLERLHEAFRKCSVLVYGKTPQEERHQNVAQFQNERSDVRLFLGGLTAAGTGITLTRSANVVFAELDWTPANISQAEDRAHRIGQKDNVLVQHLVMDGSIESFIAEKLIWKQTIIDRAIDGRSTTHDMDVDILSEAMLQYTDNQKR